VGGLLGRSFFSAGCIAGGRAEGLRGLRSLLFSLSQEEEKNPPALVFFRGQQPPWLFLFPSSQESPRHSSGLTKTFPPFFSRRDFFSRTKKPLQRTSFFFRRLKVGHCAPPGVNRPALLPPLFPPPLSLFKGEFSRRRPPFFSGVAAPFSLLC